MSENITFPQTTEAGGKNEEYKNKLRDKGDFIKIMWPKFNE